MTGQLTGTWAKWVMFDRERVYGTVTAVPFEVAADYVMAYVYNGEKGKGQQREIVQAHARKIQRDMEAGNYTPTPVAAALEKRHRDHLVLHPDGTFVLTVDTGDPLAHTDGGHRFEATKQVIRDLTARLAKATDPAERARLERWLAQAKTVPVAVMLYFDGDPSRDFLNLQKGRPVDASHIQSLSLSAGLLDDPAAKQAHLLARQLHKQEGSPFRGLLKLDSRGSQPLPIATLTARGTSDLATSLVGLARVGQAAKKSTEFLATAVTDAFAALVDADAAAPGGSGTGILAGHKVLAPIANGGGKGASTLLTGVGLCLAHRLILAGADRARPADLEALTRAAAEELDRPVDGAMSSQTKRELIARFARALFADLAVPKHGGIPVDLLKTLSCSAFSVPALPKEPAPAPAAKKGKKPRANPLPDLSGPVTVPAAAPPVVPAPEPLGAPLPDLPRGVETALQLDIQA